jgi:hypothetical protein
MPLSQRKCILHNEKCLVWLMEVAREGVHRSFENEDRTAFYRALWLMDALEEEKPAKTHLGVSRPAVLPRFEHRFS